LAVNDDFAESAQQYAQLARELSTDYEVEGEAGAIDEVMDAWGGNPPPSKPLDWQSKPHERFKQQVQERQQAQQQQEETRQQAHQVLREEQPIEYFEQRANHTDQAITQDRWWAAVDRSEAEAKNPDSPAHLPDYLDAVKHLETGRWNELRQMLPDHSPQAQQFAQQHGYRTVADLRLGILNHNRIEVANQAFQMGKSPAQHYYDLAQQRGYKSQAALNRHQTNQLADMFDTDPEQAELWWNHYAGQGRL
jgi:hypothetical protein